MKRSEHSCAACGQPAKREYPFCLSCWRDVPKELRKAVRDALGAGDDDAARDAVARAAASVEGLHEPEPAEMTEAVWGWNLAYLKAGSPKLEEKRKN